MRLVEGGVAALGDDLLVEGPDGATLILCFGQRESIRQYTIAFTHNNKNRLLQPSVCFCLPVFGVPAQEASTDSLAYYRLMVLFPCLLLSTICFGMAHLYFPFSNFKCFSSLVSEILVTFRDMAIATHTCNCARYSWAISIHFYSLHVGKRHALQLVHCALVACKNKALCSLLSRHLSSSNFVYLGERTSGRSILHSWRPVALVALVAFVQRIWCTGYVHNNTSVYIHAQYVLCENSVRNKNLHVSHCKWYKPSLCVLCVCACVCVCVCPCTHSCTCIFCDEKL